jgi:protein involved in sex pheromone biosynthesis
MKNYLLFMGLILILSACNDSAEGERGLKADSLKNDPQTGQPIIIPQDSVLQNDTTLINQN